MSGSWRLNHAIETLLDGGIIGYPTEGLWGLGCLPESREGVQRILSLKQRSWKEGLILIASDPDQLAAYLVGLPDEQLRVLKQSRSVPTTYLVRDNGYCPDWIRGQHATVAVRITTHEQTRNLCQALQSPIVSTSANRRGKPAARDQLSVRARFGVNVDTYLAGPLGGATGASEIRDLASGQILRAAE